MSLTVNQRDNDRGTNPMSDGTNSQRDPKATTVDSSSIGKRHAERRKTGSDPSKSLAILTGWQLASYRGYAIAEKGVDRRLVVQELSARLAAEHLNIPVLVLAADAGACGRIERALGLGGKLPDGWIVQTPDVLLDGGGQVRSDCVVVADELEVYLSDELATVLSSARAVLGLCASPGGLGNQTHLRKYIGRVLQLVESSSPLDVHPLAEKREPDRAIPNAHEATDILDDYLSKIQKLPLLTATEEVDLAKRIEAGLYAAQLMFELAEKGEKLPAAQRRDMQWICRDGERAKTHFLVANLRLVYHVARNYGRQFEIMDAIQEGNLGLIRAVEKYDYTTGYKFSTYAMWWIRQAITRAIADKARTIRIPVHLVEVINKMARIQRDLFDGLGREPTPAELAREMDITSEKVLELQQYASTEPESLEQLIEEEGDYIEDSGAELALEAVGFNLQQDRLQDQLRAVLETLSEREAGVVRLRFGLVDDIPRTLDEIGQVYGVTRERIRQIETKVMDKLRHPSRSQVLRDYLDD